MLMAELHAETLQYSQIHGSVDSQDMKKHGGKYEMPKGAIGLE